MKPKALKNTNGEITSYQFRIFVGRDAAGKQKYATKTWKPDRKYTPRQLEKELLRQQHEFENEVKEGYTNADLCATGNMTFENFSGKWMDEISVPNHKIRTVETNRTMLKRINFAIGKIPLNKITPEIINKFILNLREKGTKTTGKNREASLSAKTVKNYYTLLSSIFNTALNWEVIPTNPVNKVPTPKVPKKQVKALSKDEVIQLFELLSTEPLKYQVFIELAILTGMRRGELLGLKWSTIDFDHNLIDIKQSILYSPGVGIYEDSTKTEESVRTIKVSRSVFDLLKIYKDEQDDRKKKLKEAWIEGDYIFTKWDGRPMHPNTPYTWFMRFQKTNNLEHCTIHMLRHTTATLLIMNGANEKLVSGRLGHSNTQTTTNIYASYLKSADEMVSTALDEILGLDKNNE